MHRKSVLIVDDDDDIREILAETLVDRGFEVATAINGRDALEVLRSMAVRPSVILLDLMMPIMSGWEFCEYRVKSSVLSKVPVIIITARRAVTPPVGVSDVLLKPFDGDELQRAIAKVVGGASVIDGQ